MVALILKIKATKSKKLVALILKSRRPNLWFIIYFIANLLNIFLTNQGERIANPGFGVGLRDFIFEQISTQNLSGLQENIQEQVQGYIPGINIISLDITGNPDQNKVNISLAYSLPNTNIEDKIEVTFS